MANIILTVLSALLLLSSLYSCSPASEIDYADKLEQEEKDGQNDPGKNDPDEGENSGEGEDPGGEDPTGPENPSDPEEPDGPEEPEEPEEPDGTGKVLVVGGGSSGVSAALQAARMGMETVLVEETPWLGGMLTATGVSAVDGNYKLRAGIFGEFTDALANFYGSYSKLQTAWVSNIMFSPKDGSDIFKKMCANEPNLEVIHGMYACAATKKAKGWRVTFYDENGTSNSIDCDILIDCTELGDVAKLCGAEYRIGMESSAETGESMAIGPNDVVQDITMVMTIKNFGRDVTIPEPQGYDESKYVNCCQNSLNTSYDTGQTLWSAEKMMSYGKLPNGEIMLNWPIFGNDYYVNLIEMSRQERKDAIAGAKLHSLGYLYFMQTKLGYNTWGLADDQYDTEDRFPYYPYHRESRRIKGEYFFTVTEAQSPYTYKLPGYRAGIAIGDYPVDHHHYAYPEWKKVSINFPKIVPFTVSLGCLIPIDTEDLIVAEKSISTSNLANGTTRLQPVTMELGQAAGALAATALKHKCAVRETKVRDVQTVLLESGAMLQPYRDCLPGKYYFEFVQRIACTGILRGEYKTEGWTNIANFRLNDDLVWNDLYLDTYYSGVEHNPSTSKIRLSEFEALLESITGTTVDTGLSTQYISRVKAAQAIDEYLHPFENFAVGFDGQLVTDM